MTPWSKIEFRLHRGDDPGGQAEHEGEDDGAERKLDRGGKEGEELGEHRLLRDHRLAEIALQHPGDVDPVLHQDRPVEAVLLAQLLVPGGVDAALARQGLDRDRPARAGSGRRRAG